MEVICIFAGLEFIKLEYNTFEMQYVIENFEYFIGIIPDLFFLLFVLFLPIVLLFKHFKRAGLKSCWYFLCSLLPSGRFHFYYITDNDIKPTPRPTRWPGYANKDM